MDCIYIAPLSKALYNLCLSFTRSHTHSHTNGDWRPCKVPTSSSGAIGVRCLAQGHFDTPRVGSNRQPSDCQTTALPAEPYRPTAKGGEKGIEKERIQNKPPHKWSMVVVVSWRGHVWLPMELVPLYFLMMWPLTKAARWILKCFGQYYLLIFSQMLQNSLDGAS